jgi:hypothetical protein
VKKSLLLAHRAASILAGRLTKGDRRRALLAAHHIEIALSQVCEFANILELPSSNMEAREYVLLYTNSAHLRKKMLRVRLDIILVFLDQLENHSDLLRGDFLPAEFEELSVARYQMAFNWGVLLNQKLVFKPDLDKCKNSL